ncbi:MAG TPA: hypothetical protein VD969_10135 [Symbiobacteriaceae bacterium]|nr:hypothetical protein [Symbiobacteriaceae bacterium]
MELYAIVQPMVFTADRYRDTTGEDDPEELTLLQLADKEQAGKVAGVLNDLYGIESDLADPRDDEGLDEQVGTLEGLHELRRMAAAVHGKTPDDYYEGRVPPGFPFNHLINHDDADGYYLPADFLHAFFIEETSIGSAVALLRELDALESVLASAFPDQVRAALAAGNGDSAGLDGPVAVWHNLRRFCRSAIDLDLPFRFG